MKLWNRKENKEKKELYHLCEEIRILVTDNELMKGEEEARYAMQQYPSAAEPHNLYGIILERAGEHVEAMKHFRAAWALNPTFLPARYNLERYGTFFTKGDCAFVEEDCKELSTGRTAS